MESFDFSMILQGVGERTIIRDGNWRIPAQVIYQAQNGAYVDNGGHLPELTPPFLEFQQQVRSTTTTISRRIGLLRMVHSFV